MKKNAKGGKDCSKHFLLSIGAHHGVTNWTIFEPSLPLKPSEARSIPPPSHIYPQTSSPPASLPGFPLNHRWRQLESQEQQHWERAWAPLSIWRWDSHYRNCFLPTIRSLFDVRRRFRPFCCCLWGAMMKQRGDDDMTQISESFLLLLGSQLSTDTTSVCEVVSGSFWMNN